MKAAQHKALLDKYIPDWESLTAMQLRQAAQSAPSNMRNQIRASWVHMMSQPPVKSVKSTKGKKTTKSKKEG